MKRKSIKKYILKNNRYFLGIITGILIALLIFKFIPLLMVKASTARIAIPFITKNTPTPTPDPSKKIEEITKQVLPDKSRLGVYFGDVLVKLVSYGAIDKEKFLALYEGRGGLTGEEKELLEKPSSEEIIVTIENAPLILNLLWPLGIANKTSVLSEGPMGKEYKKDVANFASTGGWTVGKESGGALFNKFAIINLTVNQEAQVREIAEEIYRPCCGNSTYFPDCNHGAAMLGFIELAVSQGMNKEEIYKKALLLNSYWFPQTYAELAVYFQAKKNTPWNQVNPKEVLGVNFSSGQGYRAINKELQSESLLPKVEGGGGCGV